MSKSRKVAFSLVAIYASLLSLTVLSYQDEILPVLVESEFLIGDEDIDHSPHLEVIRYCHAKIRSPFRPRFGLIANRKPTVKIAHWNKASTKWLQFLALHWHGDIPVLLSVFRI